MQSCLLRISDRISDITTKIIKHVLIDYTQEQCSLHKIPMELVLQEDIFDYEKLRWVKRKCYLPVFQSKPIILVPKSIVRLENVAGKNIGCFYRFAIRNFLSRDKDLLVDISPTGKDGQILIRDVKAEHPISKESLTQWSIKYGRLLVDYKSDVLKDRIYPLSDLEIMNIVYSNDGLSKAS
jgi:hypothetical protein